MPSTSGPNTTAVPPVDTDDMSVQPVFPFPSPDISVLVVGGVVVVVGVVVVEVVVDDDCCVALLLVVDVGLLFTNIRIV